MVNGTATRTVEFTPSGQRATVDLGSLRDAAVEFLELWAEPPLVGPDFLARVGDGGGERRFGRLLAEAGCDGDPGRFFDRVLEQLAVASTDAPAEVVVGNVRLPGALALELLGVVLPGDELIDVKRLAKLEKLTNVVVPTDRREDLQAVLDQYPVRLSTHVVRQMRLSPAVAYQYLPFADELDEDGLVHTWVGQFHRGVIEQMYRNRVIFVLNMSCPVYCRFCFRKHKECRTQKAPTQRHVSLGLEYIRQSPSVKEIVVTGGDPFLNRPTLTWAVDGLSSIRHVETLRLATRSIAYHPALFTARDGWWLHWLERKQLELAHKGKRLEVATHFIHPDEVSRHSLEVISELTGRGVPVYVQTPLLGGCNDRGPELAELFRLLRGAGAEMHYIFMPCSPLQGNSRYRSSLDDGFRAFGHLRTRLSDRAVPHLCTATSIGKIDWGTSGWVVETDDEDPRYLWLRTPYTSEYFESFAPILDLSRVARLNDEGTLDARFWVDVGDPSWLRGGRESAGYSRGAIDRDDFPDDAARDGLAELQRAALERQGPGPALLPSRSVALTRVHRARAELDLGAAASAVDAAVDEIAADDRITDVVVYAERDAVRCLHALGAVHGRLVDISHVTALRIRSRRLVAEPAAWSPGVVGRVGGLNRLGVTRPLRIEVEAVVLHPSELGDEVARVVGGLRRRGVTAYAVVPLLAFLNDADDDMTALTGACRQAGIEVHHLVLGGHPLQAEWAADHPVHLGRVVDLATVLRREGSGRELPRMIVQTALGECDFGLTGEAVRAGDDGSVAFRLLAETATELEVLGAGVGAADGVEVGDDGRPAVVVPGLLY